MEATRRTVLGWVPAAALAGLPAAASLDRWGELRAGFEWFSPQIAQAFRRAQEAGVNPEDLAWVMYPCRQSGWVTFETRERLLVSFDADGEISRKQLP